MEDVSTASVEMSEGTTEMKPELSATSPDVGDIPQFDDPLLDNYYQKSEEHVDCAILETRIKEEPLELDNHIHVEVQQELLENTVVCMSIKAEHIERIQAPVHHTNGIQNENGFSGIKDENVAYLNRTERDETLKHSLINNRRDPSLLRDWPYPVTLYEISRPNLSTADQDVDKTCGNLDSDIQNAESLLTQTDITDDKDAVDIYGTSQSRTAIAATRLEDNTSIWCCDDNDEHVRASLTEIDGKDGRITSMCGISRSRPSDPVLKEENGCNNAVSGDENLQILKNSLPGRDKCLSGEKAFLKKSTLAEHEKSHGENPERPYKCTLCSHTTTRKCYLDVHLRKHTGDKRYKCTLCDFRTIQQNCLTEHMRRHTGEKPYACSVCDYRTSRRPALVIHMTNHSDDKPFKCSVCAYSSAQKGNFLVHMRKHSGEKPYVCSLCDYSSARKDNLQAHIRIHTGEKPYKCSFCEYCATDKSTLDRHTSTHIKEKPYACTLCKYSAYQKRSLDCHMTKHTGYKPYVCSFCPYASAYKNAWARHVQRHADGTGHEMRTKPHKCKYCGYASNYKGYLVRHMKLHTEEKSLNTAAGRLGEIKDVENDVEYEVDSQISVTVTEGNGPTLSSSDTEVNKISTIQPEVNEISTSHTEQGGTSTCDTDLNLISGSPTELSQTSTCAKEVQTVATSKNNLQSPSTNCTDGSSPVYTTDLFAELAHYDDTDEKFAPLVTSIKIKPCHVALYRCEMPADIALSMRKINEGKTSGHSDSSNVALGEIRPATVLKTSTQLRQRFSDFSSSHESTIVDHVKSNSRKRRRNKSTNKVNGNHYLVSRSGKHSGDLETKNVRIYDCSFCEKKYSKRIQLVHHMKSHANDPERPFRCSICDHTTTQYGYLEVHMKSHIGDKRYKCTFCSFRTIQKQGLTAHMRRHTGEKPYACSVCDYTTSYKPSLVIHMNNHSVSKPFKCSICDYSSAQKGNFLVHMRKHSGEKPYVCSLCDYSSTRKDNLQAHVRIHTGEKPHKCSFCDYCATDKSTLYRHTMRHIKDKPYACTICDYSAYQKRSLDYHMTNHTGYKPYMCWFCPYASVYKHAWVRHVQRHGDGTSVIGHEIKHTTA